MSVILAGVVIQDFFDLIFSVLVCIHFLHIVELQNLQLHLDKYRVFTDECESVHDVFTAAVRPRLMNTLYYSDSTRASPDTTALSVAGTFHTATCSSFEMF